MVWGLVWGLVWVLILGLVWGLVILLFYLKSSPTTSGSRSRSTYLFMILKSITKYASHLDPYKMMSSNVAKTCDQMLQNDITT